MTHDTKNGFLKKRAAFHEAIIAKTLAPYWATRR
jgi:hypothetical protein